jgi:hypothetical protein
MSAANVISRNPATPEGVSFPVNLYRASEDGTVKSVAVETPKDLADFMKAGYAPGAIKSKPTPEAKAKAKAMKKRMSRTRVKAPKDAGETSTK